MGHRKFRFAIVFLLALSLAACAARPIHPGAANKFDSDSYDALLVTDSVIQSCRADIAANVFPANVAPGVKAALNNLINAYNVADIAYKAYHAAAVTAAGPTPAQQAAVSSSLTQVSSATTALTNAKAGGS